MTEQTIFDSADQAPEAVAQPIPQVPVGLEGLVGEGKKYATVEAALASLPHAQSHISKLEAELAQMREELGKRQTTQELLEELRSSNVTPKAVTPAKEFNQDEITRLIEQTISQKETQKIAETNSKSVVNKFVELYGQEKAKEQFLKLSQETGVSLAELNRLASISPSAVFKLAGIGTQATPPAGKLSSDVRTPDTSTQQPLSAKVHGTSTKDVLDAWRRAGEKVRQNLNLS